MRAKMTPLIWRWTHNIKNKKTTVIWELKNTKREEENMEPTESDFQDTEESTSGFWLTICFLHLPLWVPYFRLPFLCFWVLKYCGFLFFMLWVHCQIKGVIFALIFLFNIYALIKCLTTSSGIKSYHFWLCSSIRSVIQTFVYVCLSVLGRKTPVNIFIQQV